MRKQWRGALAAMLALLMGMLPAAQAEFSPGYESIMAGEAIRLTLSGRLDQAAALSEESLAVVNAWLNRLQLTLSSGETETANWARASAAYDGKSLLSIATVTETDQTVTVFEHAGTAYRTAPDQPDALSLLAGASDGLPRLELLPDAYAQGAQALYACLAEKTTPKHTKASTSIRNATASAAYENYILKADEMNAAWPEILAQLWPMLEPALQNMPNERETLQTLLSSLVFSGECRFKRFLDKEGGDMGLQFTGNAAQGEDKRKATLFGGFTPDKGGYVSLALPAVKGKNNTKLTVSWKLTEKSGQHTLTLEAQYTNTLNGETKTAALNVNLKNTVKNGGEAWTGTITWASQEPGENRRQWQLKPTLTLDGNGLHGDVAVQRKEKNKVDLKATLSLSLTACDVVFPETSAAVDLRGMDDVAARTAVSGEMQPLTLALARLMAALPEESRSLLLHDLRTDAWMNGPTAGLDGTLPETKSGKETPSTDWIVKEDDN